MRMLFLCNNCVKPFVHEKYLYYSLKYLFLLMMPLHRNVFDLVFRISLLKPHTNNIFSCNISTKRQRGDFF